MKQYIFFFIFEILLNFGYLKNKSIFCSNTGKNLNIATGLTLLTFLGINFYTKVVWTYTTFLQGTYTHICSWREILLSSDNQLAPRSDEKWFEKSVAGRVFKWYSRQWRSHPSLWLLTDIIDMVCQPSLKTKTSSTSSKEKRKNKMKALAPRRALLSEVSESQ